MCTNKQYVHSPYVHYPILVKCGHCEACLQEKAFARANRIRANLSSDAGANGSKMIAVFVTLTYKNDYVPYFWHADLVYAPIKNNRYEVDDTTPSLVYDYYKEVPIYRDYRVRYVRFKKGGYKVRKRITKDRELLDVVRFSPEASEERFKYLKGQGSRKIGVCYFKDLQDFQKRLRINLKRRGYGFSYSFYQCSEYGPKTARPHFHLLCFIPETMYAAFKIACSRSWPFDDGYRTRANIEVARDAASYVASYVNCDTTIPKAFKTNRQIRPSHSYSQGFGTALYDFSFREVCKKIERGNLRFSRASLRNGTLVVDDCIIPKYVVSRYFPKFTGYSRLTSDEVESILLNPSELARYANQLEYSKADLHVNITRLRNKLTMASSYGVSRLDYARLYTRVWPLYSSEVMRDFYDGIDCLTKNFTAYDNIKDFYSGDVLSPSLDDAFLSCPSEMHCFDNPNAFPENVAKDRRMRDYYFSYSKDRKVRNHIYSQFDFNV